MNTQSKCSTRRRAASIVIALALATSGAWAGTVVWNGNAENGSLSDGGNWDGGSAPVAGDTLDFSAITSATTLNADFGDDRTFATAKFGTGVLTLDGELRFDTLTNASTLAVSSGASLIVTGNIVALVESKGGSQTFLHSNEGAVMVGGQAIASSNVGSGPVVCQFESADENTKPMRVGGLAYNCGSSGQLNFRITSRSDKPGMWVVGSDGFKFTACRNASYTRFYPENAVATLYSSADWGLRNSGKYKTNDGDICISSGQVVIDTSDYDDPAVPHTVTLNGRIIAKSSAQDPAVVIKGCGTVVLDTSGSNASLAENERHTSIDTSISVTDTATFKVNDGKKILGTGTIMLATGTKLLIPNAVGGTATLNSLAPAAGSTIVVSNLVAGTPAIELSHGGITLPDEGKVTLKIGGTSQLADGIYTVLLAAEALPAGAVDHLALDASEVVPGACSLYARNGVLFLLVGVAEPSNGIWIGGADSNMSTAANWLNYTVPVAGDTLNFMTVVAPTTINADFGDDRVFETAVLGSGVLTLTGSLRVENITNAYTLAIASAGSLTVRGDLVGYAGANENKSLLYSNYGTVTVGGKVHFRDCGMSRYDCKVSQYAVADANSTPIIANGLAYDADKTDTGAWYSGYLVANLGSMNNGPGKWVVGSDGFTYPASRIIDRSGFRALGSQAVTLYSSADWTLAESYRHQGNDLYFENTATVTIDTTDYNDHTTGHTVTLEGYINAQGTAETPLIVSGCGKVVLDSVPANGHNNVVNGAIAVTDGATLQINKDVVVGGSGTILLAAGATLSLPANDDKTFSVRDIVPLTLPTEGTAAIRIDGARLNLGNYEIATVASGTNVTLDPTSTAVSGRRTSLKIENDKLVLSLSPAGTILFFR